VTPPGPVPPDRAPAVSAPQLVNPDRSITLPIQLGQLARLALPPSAAAAVAGWGVNDRTSQVGSMSRRPYVLFSQYFCPAVNQYRPRRTSSHTSSHRARARQERKPGVPGALGRRCRDGHGLPSPSTRFFCGVAALPLSLVSILQH
jgi:hypothetical protein